MGSFTPISTPSGRLVAIGMLGNKTPQTREAVLFLRGHLENFGSEITATRKLSKWVVFTRQGKLKTNDNKRGIVAEKLRLIKNHIVATVETFGFIECFVRSVVNSWFCDLI